MIRHAGSLVAAFTVASIATACGSGDTYHGTGQVDENGVRVDIVVSANANGDGQVVATFTPDKSGFHVYSIDLPADGVQGLGRPTKVAVSGGLAATGTQQADKQVRHLRPSGVDVDLPVYPDGPVTVTLPVHRSTAAASVLISYAACSESQGCLMPVSDKAIPVTLN